MFQAGEYIITWLWTFSYHCQIMLSFAILTLRKYALLSVLAMLVPANQSCFFLYDFDFSIASALAPSNEKYHARTAFGINSWSFSGMFTTLEQIFLSISSMINCNLDSRLLWKKGLLYFNILLKYIILSILSFPTSQKEDALLLSYLRLTQNLIVLQSRLMDYNSWAHNWSIANVI